MKPKSAKQKGRLLQQKVRDLILAAFPSLTPNDVRSTGMGQQGADVQLSEAALKIFPHSVECKNLASIAIYKHYEQAQANAKEGQIPLLIIKQNHSEPLAVIDAEWFIKQQGK